MSKKFATLALLATGLLVLVAPERAEADGRFSFGLNIWGPPPVYFGPRYYAEPIYGPPVIVRRVYVTPPPETIYVTPSAPAQPLAPAATPAPVPSRPVPIPAPAPTTARRSKQPDMVLVKIGELYSEDNDEREDAAKFLGESHDSRAVRPLISVLQHDRKDDVREEAARALGEIGGPEAERVLTIASTSDPDDDVRRAASKALTRMARQPTRSVTR